MISIERVAKVFGFRKGKWSATTNLNGNPCVFSGSKNVCGIERDFNSNSIVWDNTRRLITKSPELLYGLIEDWQFIEHFLACHGDLLPPIIYDDFLMRQHLIENKLESCDRQGWEWETLKGELLG